MITLENARIQQKKAQKKSVTIFLGSIVLFTAVCVGLYFVGKREFYIGIYLSLLALLYIGYKVKLTEFLRPKEYEGEVTYFNVRTEQFKKVNSHQAGNTYGTYIIYVAEMFVKDKKGRTRYKSFRHTKEYDNIKAGDKATVLRFVDKPVIVFKD
jgi:hypothetical protein